MRGTKAKLLRRLVYGTEFSQRERKYQARWKIVGKRQRVTIENIERRQVYQQLKKRPELTPRRIRWMLATARPR